MGPDYESQWNGLITLDSYVANKYMAHTIIS